MTQPTIDVVNLNPDQREILMQRLLQTRQQTLSAVSAIERPLAAFVNGHADAPLPRPAHQPSHVRFEPQSLYTLIKTGKIPPVAAAALGYWPDELLSTHPLSRAGVIEKQFHNRATVASIVETGWGRIAIIILPRLHSELYADPTLTAEIRQALALAGEIGAQSVSLTGLLPSATDYGHKIAHSLPNRTDLPSVTTGHAMTAASVVLNIGKISEEARRPLAKERVAFLGLGSIGLTSLRLMLQALPHPQTLLLCDLFHKYHDLQTLRAELVQEYGFRGDLQIVPVHQDLPPVVYEATLIVGATNVPDVLAVRQLKPGTLLVDDSGPHCFNAQQAIARFTQQADILFTEGGAVQLPTPVQQIYYAPPHLETIFADGEIDHPQLIMGCVLSSLLSTPLTALPPTVGPIDPEVCLAYYQTVKQMGIQAAPLHCAAYRLAPAAIQRFRQQFSTLV